MFVIIMTVFLIMFKLVSFEAGYAVNISGYNKHVGIGDLPLIFNILQIINCVLVAVALVMKLKSRRSYQLANYLYFIFLIIEVISGLGAFGGCAYVKITTPNENGRDANVLQIEVITKDVEILNEMRYYREHVIDKAYKGVFYTIIDTIRKGNNDSCLVWYQIRTGKGINAYICGQDVEVTYVKELPVESN